MKNDFKPQVGHSFNLRGEWGGVLDCEVLTVEPDKTLAYSWDFDARGSGLRPEERGDLHPDPDRRRARTCASSRPVSVPTRSRPRRRPRRLEVVPRQPGPAAGAAGLGAPPDIKGESLELEALIRQTHRWLSILFTAGVVGYMIVMTKGQPPAWVGLFALVPLILLLVSGLYMFVLPYVARGRR
jgi:hypothetical protein